MIQVNVPAAYRSEFGKGASRQLRMNNQTPAVLYSGGNDAVALQCDTKVLFKELYDIHGRNAVITLAVEGDKKKEHHVLIQEIQKNPVTDQLVHVDFFEIELKKPAVFSVPIKYVGTPKGVELGGELNLLSTSVKLKGCPLDIPDDIEINIAELDRGDSLCFSDLSLPEKVEMLNQGDKSCIAIY